MKGIFLLISFILALTTGAETVRATTVNDSLQLADSSAAHFLSTDSTAKALRPAAKNDNPILRVMWITFVLLFFLLSGMLAYKKFVLKGSITRSTKIAILARQAIAPKQSILIVRIEDKKYALGATDHALNVLAELGPVSADEPSDAEKKGTTVFAEVLKKITKHG